MRRPALALVTTVVLLGLALLVLAPSVAAADGSPILVADDAPAELKVADDGSATLSLTFSNPGDTLLNTSASVDGDAPVGCTITPEGGGKLPAHREQAIAFMLSEECVPAAGESVALVVTVGAEPFDITAKNPDATDARLPMIGRNFGLALFISVVAMAIAYGFWAGGTNPGVSRKPLQSLHGLESTWKFSDAWATNATVLTAVFAGVFGAKGVTELIVGDSASDLLASAVVAAAIALGLVGLGPMVLQIFRKREHEPLPGGTGFKDAPAGFYFSPLGLLIAGTLTLTGTVGQLFSILAALKETSLGSATAWESVGVVAMAVVVIYAVQSTRQNLAVGVTFSPAESATVATATGTVALSNVNILGMRRGFGATL